MSVLVYNCNLRKGKKANSIVGCFAAHSILYTVVKCVVARKLEAAGMFHAAKCLVVESLFVCLFVDCLFQSECL